MGEYAGYVGEDLGLRERKKRRTRLAISEVATRLFIQHGFDQVTVAEVAKVADVSVNTVFNYFPTKEDLFFDRQDEVEDAPSRLVRERAPGESVVAALRRHFLSALERRDPGLAISERRIAFWRTIQDSPALQARRREIAERTRDALARTLAEETGTGHDDVIPRIVANQVSGVYEALFAEVRRRLLAGQSVDEVYAAVLPAARRAFDLLEHGVGDYCVRQG